MQHSIIYDTAVDDPGEVALSVAYTFGFDSVEQLLDAADGAVVGDTDAEDQEPANAKTYPGGWTKSKMRRYVKALKPTAQTVLRAIAINAPGADVDDVQAASGVDGYSYAGSMSSFGFAARNTYGVKEKPFVKIGKKYEIHSEVAALAIVVLDELGL